MWHWKKLVDGLKRRHPIHELSPPRFEGTPSERPSDKTLHGNELDEHHVAQKIVEEHKALSQACLIAAQTREKRMVSS